LEASPQDGAGAVVEADKPWSLEQHAIEPIPATDRHGTPGELFRMWIGANINYVAMVTGSLAYSQLLSFWHTLTAILVGNLIGCTVLGLCSIQGPRTGTAGILGSRACFGQAGAILPIAISLISALSWFSIQSVVATQSLQELFKLAGITQPAIAWVAVGLILAAEIALAVFGHATIIVAERWIGVALAVLFAGLVAFIVPLLLAAPTTAAAVPPAAPVTLVGWLVTVGIVGAYPIGWTNFASDYSRYFPARTPWTAIALSAGAGQFVSLVFCQLIGVLFAMALHGVLGNDPVSQLGTVLPHWYLIPFLVAVILGGIAANVPNGYTAALGMLALRLPINRITSLAVIAVFTLLVRIVTVYFGQFYELYQQFLDTLVFWTAPWAAIIVCDHFLRRGNYNARDLMVWGRGQYWYTHGVFAPGVIAFVLGVIASILCCNSETFASPFAVRFLGGSDLSLEAGLLVPAVIYILAARTALRGAAASTALAQTRA
jgi:NCS1 family nucleobase:cation symporter-1